MRSSADNIEPTSQSTSDFTSVGHVNTAALSNRAVRSVAFILSGLLSIGIIAQLVRIVLWGEASHNALYIACAILPLLVLSGFLAERGYRRAAFAAIYANALIAIVNGVYIQGFGVYAPSLVTVLVPVALSFAMFRFREAFLWCTPLFVIWLGVFTFNAIGMGLPEVWNRTPPTANMFLGLFATLVAVACLGAVFSMEYASALSASESARRKLQAAIDQLDEAEIAKREREKFMGELSHEIRTPLAALRSAVSLMKHEKATPAMKERSFELIDTTSANLLGLLNDALDSFKLGSTQFQLNEGSFDLIHTVTDVTSLFSATARAKGLMLAVDMTGVRSGRVIGDANRLRQMLSNLVGNAIKFTQRGEVRIRVVAPSTERANVWRIEVGDTGTGIPPEKLSQLFKPFSQVHDPRAIAVAGSGLGLSIVQQLAAAMNGRVGVNSVVGQGSTFWFEVQLLQEPVSASLKSA